MSWTRLTVPDATMHSMSTMYGVSIGSRAPGIAAVAP
jgi:hypothetical protein